jgi:hypothetical protein
MIFRSFSFSYVQPCPGRRKRSPADIKNTPVPKHPIQRARLTLLLHTTQAWDIGPSTRHSSPPANATAHSNSFYPAGYAEHFMMSTSRCMAASPVRRQTWPVILCHTSLPLHPTTFPLCLRRLPPRRIVQPPPSKLLTPRGTPFGSLAAPSWTPKPEEPSRNAGFSEANLDVACPLIFGTRDWPRSGTITTLVFHGERI